MRQSLGFRYVFSLDQSGFCRLWVDDAYDLVVIVVVFGLFRLGCACREHEQLSVESIRAAYEKRLKYVWKCEKTSPPSLHLGLAGFVNHQCRIAYRLEKKHWIKDSVVWSWKTYCSQSGAVVDDKSQQVGMLVEWVLAVCCPKDAKAGLTRVDRVL